MNNISYIKSCYPVEYIFKQYDQLLLKLNRIIKSRNFISQLKKISDVEVDLMTKTKLHLVSLHRSPAVAYYCKLVKNIIETQILTSNISSDTCFLSTLLACWLKFKLNFAFKQI
ncbi:hypothetical protein BpHYR1_013813 [Brachionus plicatilis]|uniref:Uncharacterized protein n=1 Tax=Brachionus plicatilis TaxID=10195 RepID=A0A3M7SWW8_BRAPC|nr:hypothetical protein BpHYR1_013813 [Brachionus plicatilis]